MRGWTMAAAALALAGCAGGEFAGFGPAVVGSGRSLPATRAEARPDLMTPPGRARDIGIAVRTFTAAPDGALQEIEGAACRVTGGALAASLVTPGRVVVPDLGPDAPALRADCETGTMAGAAIVPPAFAWSRGGGNPPQRVLWGLGWTYGYEKVGPMGYPELPVILSERAL
jgi:hypothetical protein